MNGVTLDGKQAEAVFRVLNLYLLRNPPPWPESLMAAYRILEHAHSGVEVCYCTP